MISIANSDSLYLVFKPEQAGLKCSFAAVRMLTKSPVLIDIDGEVKNLSLPPSLNNQPIQTYAKDIFIPYV